MTQRISRSEAYISHTVVQDMPTSLVYRAGHLSKEECIRFFDMLTRPSNLDRNPEIARRFSGTKYLQIPANWPNALQFDLNAQELAAVIRGTAKAFSITDQPEILVSCLSSDKGLAAWVSRAQPLLAEFSMAAVITIGNAYAAFKKGGVTPPPETAEDHRLFINSIATRLRAERENAENSEDIKFAVARALASIAGRKKPQRLDKRPAAKAALTPA